MNLVKQSSQIVKHSADKIKDWALTAKNIAMDTILTNETMWETEVSANIMTARVFILLMIVSLLSFVFIQSGLLASNHAIDAVITEDLILLLPAIIICKITKGRKKFLKFYMMIVLVACVADADAMYTIAAVLLMVLPVIVSSRYYNKGFTIFACTITFIAFIISAQVGVKIGDLDLNHIYLTSDTTIPAGVNLSEALRYASIDIKQTTADTLFTGFMPKAMIFVVISIFAVSIADRGYKMVQYQAEISREHARIESELNIARAIQERTLPETRELVDHPSFDLCVFNEPAKEVCGDFYDFLMIDDTHLALVMADVSGKGVPAAMFMMVSKILLDVTMTASKGPAEILAAVNHLLCEKNMEQMFVTLWLGIIDLETGKMKAANAGHEYPLICKKGGKFELYHDKHGLFLGGMDGARYKEYELDFQPGDSIFLYTDGIPEANDADKKFYGMDRLMEALDKNNGPELKTLLSGLYEDLLAFVSDAPQFDDITMMAFRLNDLIENNGMTVPASEESLHQIHTFLVDSMKSKGIPQEILDPLDAEIKDACHHIAADSNAEWVKAEINITDNQLQIIITNNGLPLEVLQTGNDAEANENTAILLEKQIREGTTYQYTEKGNMLTITRQLNG